MTAFEPHAGNGDYGPAGPEPLSLVLRAGGRCALVAGGGSVAHRKVLTLVAAGLEVRVVAPELDTGLAAWREAGSPWRWDERVFRAADVSGMFLVVAATGDRGANARIAAAARQEGALVNVVDDPSACDFFLPAVVHRGPLQIAVSTGSRAPGMAAEMRKRLEKLYGEEWGRAVDLVGRARTAVLEGDFPEEKRRAFVRNLSALDIGGLLEEGGLPRVNQAIEQCVSRHGD